MLVIQKKRLIVAGVILFFSVIFLAVTLSLLFKSDKSADTNDLEMPFVVRTEECTATDSISYMYYDSKPADWEPNNKFGLYIYAENSDFFEIAQNLVNSKGGDWGYVLIPYNMADRDKDKWTRVFSQLEQKHLIPIIQLWDVDTKNYREQTREAAQFLNRFVWPIRYRYISAYNEMNDAKFWYNRVDPAEYANILDYTITTFKEENPDFFIMNGAFNVSATTNNESMDAYEYMLEMNTEHPGIFERLDGWASHSYPQPNFSGNPMSTGRWSIKAYEEELKFLEEELGVEKELPVFITETGWAHAEGENYNYSFLSVEEIANRFKTAYEKVWLPDKRVRAVMPFTIRYEPPFDHFSWINKDKVPYKHYDVIKNMKKQKGEPPVLKYDAVEVNNCR